MVDTIATRVQLTGGIEAPQYVFGTGGIFKPLPIHHALSEGYRAFDTAQMYNNEREVGEAIRSYPDIKNIDRKDLFIITKVKEAKSTVEETYQTLKESVEVIGLGGYVDLFFIHNPCAGPEGRKIQWQALERAKKEGLTRAIGVSNYVVRHLDEMKEYATEMPAVNQTELSPFFQAQDVAAWCKKENVMLQAFAPVVRGQKKDEPVLLEIAKQVGKSWSHVLLRYGWQKNGSKERQLTDRYMVTCKSETPSRITDNVQIFDFELNKDQMSRLDKLECGFKVTPSFLPDPEDRRKYYEEMP